MSFMKESFGEPSVDTAWQELRWLKVSSSEDGTRIAKAQRVFHDHRAAIIAGANPSRQREDQPRCRLKTNSSI